MGSLKEKLLASAQLRTKVVEVDGSKIVVREVSAAAFAAYGAGLKTDKEKATAGLVSACVFDEEGNQVLTPEEALDLVKSSRVAMPIVNAIMEVSGFKEDDAEKEAVAS